MRVGIIALSLASLATMANAQELAPADYSPTESVSIRTTGLSGAEGEPRNVKVAITNRTDKPVDVRYSCSVFRADGEPLASVFGNEQAVPPKQQIASASVTSFIESGDQVACRVTDARTSRLK